MAGIAKSIAGHGLPLAAPFVLLSGVRIAGAILTPETPARGLSLRARLDRNDGHGFLEALSDGIITGPTLTNVNDFARS